MRRRGAWFKTGVVCGGALLLAGCAGPLSTVDPAGPSAEAIASLWWAMLIGATLLFCLVMALLLWVFVKPAADRSASPKLWLVGGGLVLPAPTRLPLITALLTGVFFVAVLFKLYWIAVLALPAIVAAFLAWTPGSGEPQDQGALPVGSGAAAVLHSEAASPPSLWAIGLTLAADATAYASLAFGLLFLWVVAPNWPPPALMAWAPWGVTLTAGGTVLAGLASLTASWRAIIGSGPRREGALAIAVIGQGMALIGLVNLVVTVPDPTRHAYAATTLVILLYAGLHVAIGAVFAGFGIWRSRTGYVSARRSVDLRIGAIWNVYTAALAVGTLLIVFGLPLVMGAPR